MNCLKSVSEFVSERILKMNEHLASYWQKCSVLIFFTRSVYYQYCTKLLTQLKYLHNKKKGEKEKKIEMHGKA